ncbi:MAG: aminoglycoside phosphotransferase family protein, partial [Proteobacteria bacterium]|nr:aminoglycoside phosphotransferase family protein [Pseudomonadota bacterium]
ALIQKTALAFLTSPTPFRTALRPAFQLSSPIPNASCLMIMPGNQRFRTFDFLHNTILVTPKHNFSAQGIQNEIQLRQRLSPSLSFIPPCQQLPNDAFTEPLLNAFPLNRLNRIAQHKAEAKAFQCLQKLHQIDTINLASAHYLSQKRTQFEAAKAQLIKKFGGLNLHRLDTLYNCAEKNLRLTQTIQTSLTHGDFQPGNILARNDNPDPIFIDFEDAAPRASAYDYLTYQLRTHAPRGLAQRIQNFTAIPQHFPQNLVLPQSPQILLALWFIEEWIWLCQTSTRDGIQDLPLGLQIQFKELQNITL